MSIDKRCKDLVWTIRGDDEKTSFAGAQLAVLMDIRDELKDLNRLLRCNDFLRIPKVLRDVERNMRKPTNGLLDRAVTEFDWGGKRLHARALSTFRAEEIRTLGDLIERRKFDLMRLPNLGRVTVDAIEVRLTELGLKLA